jgi:4-hydroxythreonine-4-phosphate dehydrogenase
MTETNSSILRIGITCGDVNGIGPEIALKAARQMPAGTEAVFIGPKTLPGLEDTLFADLWDIPLQGEPVPGTVTAEASQTAFAAIEQAVQGCLHGRIDAMVTSPICKEGLRLADIPFPGHTEMIAAMTGTKRYGMMLMGRGLRVMLATRHLPLRDVAQSLTKEAVEEVVGLTAEALQKLGRRDGCIGVCGLNPHAGDGGTLGDEEENIIRPAIEAAVKKGISATGPVPADVIFYQALNGTFDAVVAMYHDQGLAPLKMHAFDCGVNWTVGLPIIRTSPDHGTAFDIAGKGIANADSMIAAIQTATELAKQK